MYLLTYLLCRCSQLCGQSCTVDQYADVGQRQQLLSFSPINVLATKILLYIRKHLNPLDSKGNYSATSNNRKLVHWPLIDGLLHLIQRGEARAGCGPVQSPPRCTKCNSPPINGQCTNHCIAMWWSVALQEGEYRENCLSVSSIVYYYNGAQKYEQFLQVVDCIGLWSCLV